MDLARLKIQHELISGLFEPINNAENSTVVINEANSVLLSFMMPNLFFKSLRLIDDCHIKRYQYNSRLQPSIDAEQPKPENENQVVVYRVNNTLTCDVHTWFCSCDVFEHQLYEDTTELERTAVSGNQGSAGDYDGDTLSEVTKQNKEIFAKFGFNRFHGDMIPVCEHLLALWIYEANKTKLRGHIQDHALSFEEWINLNNELI